MEKRLIPNIEFETVIKESDINSMLKDYSELILDKNLEDGILKEIPIISTIVSSIKFGNSVNEYFFRKKIFKFLFQLKDIPINKREQVIEKINVSEKYQNKVGETIIELLDKIETEGKPEILGKMLGAVIEEKMDYFNFLKASHIVKSIFYYDLVMLKEAYDGEYVNNYSNDSLIIAGVINLEIPNWGNQLEKSLNFDMDSYKELEEENSSRSNLSEIGKIIIEVGMK